MTTESPKVDALILAAGLGTRLRPLTDTIPKCLAPISGRPLLDYWVERLRAAGVRRARVNTHALADQARAYIEAVNRSGRFQLAESHEPTLLGSAGTVTANADLADDADAIVIIYADNFSDVDLGRLLDFHRGHGDPFTMLLFRAANPSACGIAELDAAGRVVSFVEKPREPRSDLANAGVYVVSAAAYREIAGMRAFDLGHEVLPRFVGRMRGLLHEGYHEDIGTPEALARARAAAPNVLMRLAGIAPGGRPAVFLDRDGTVIEHVHYLHDPADARLLPGAAEAIRALRAAGYASVLVTNQSGIGRGMFSEAQMHAVNDAMNRQLAAEGTELDAIYFCPAAPSGEGRTTSDHPDRKPAPGMLLRAAAELRLDLSASWVVGDMVSDVLAGVNAGCRGGILVASGKPLDAADAPLVAGRPIVTDLLAATRRILDEPPRIPAGGNEAETTSPRS